MHTETAVIWGGLTFGTALAMAIVFDRDRLLRWALVRGLFWGVYVLYSLWVH